MDRMKKKVGMRKTKIEDGVGELRSGLGVFAHSL